MGRAVFTNTDTVVGQNVGGRDVHDGRKSCHRLYIVTEYEEGRAEAAKSVKGKTVSDSGHRDFTYTVVKVTSAVIFCGEVACFLHVSLGRRMKVSCTTNKTRNLVLQTVDNHTGQVSGSFRLVFVCPEISVVDERLCDIHIELVVPSLLHLRELSAVLSKELVPSFFVCCLCFADCLVVCIYLFRYEECFFARPVEVLLHLCDVLITQRLAVCACLALLARATVTDLSLNLDHGRSGEVCLCLSDSCCHCINIVTVLNGNGLESVSIETCLNILSKCDVGAAFDGNLVAIVKNDELAKL